MQVTWDPQKARSNLTKHGVDFADAAVALEDLNALMVEDFDHPERRFKTLAMSPSSDVLLIVHTEHDQETIRIISARKADRSEESFYYGDDYG